MLAAMMGLHSSPSLCEDTVVRWGLLLVKLTSASTMPQMAPAARVKMIFEIRFKPATSTILGIMVMSLEPT